MEITRLKTVPIPYNKEIPGSVYHVTEGTAHAYVNPGGQTLRIPFVYSKERGDFKLLIDNLVSETGTNKIRFVNIFGDKETRILDMLLDNQNNRNISDAVHGFDEVTENWNGEPVRCLEGEWGT